MAEKVEVVAEIGKNWIFTENELSVQENLEMAKALVSKAKESGADVAKFQCHVFEDEKYKRHESRYEWIKRNERATPYNEFWVPLKAYCDKLAIEMLVTPMSVMAAQKINPLVKRWKIGSADIVNMPLVNYIVAGNKPVLASTGMSSKQQVHNFIIGLMGAASRFTIMHCVSIYPCPEDKLNLGTIIWLREQFHIPVGFSDHSLSVEVPAYAVVAGAKIIEKHMTLDRSAFGPDHRISLLPNEFKEMVENIRMAEVLFGVKDKILWDEEQALWSKFRV